MRLQELVSCLPKDEHVFITGHVHPDGDCIGATLALNSILKDNHFNTTVILEERPKMYAFLPGYDAICTYDEFFEKYKDLENKHYSLIVMDSGDLTRIAPIHPCFEHADLTVNIDHHDSNDHYANKNYVDIKASSTCEMVGILIGLLDGDISSLTKSVAQCLYTGIIYDTGVFKHNNTRRETHLVASYLVNTGIDHSLIANRLFFTKSIKKLKAMELALNHLELHEDGQIASTFLSYEELQQNELAKSDTENVVSLLSEVEGSKACVFFLELQKEEYKLSFRSSSEINVCQVAKAFGGGGHIKASGANISGNRDKVVLDVLKELIREFKRYY